MRTMQAIFCKKLPSAELTDNGPLTRERARDLQREKEIEKFCESVSRLERQKNHFHEPLTDGT
jgi:hypothetical protein